MNIVHPDIETYLNKMTHIPHPVLEEMEKVGKSRNFPIIGPQVGRLLYLLIEFGHVHTILECGTGFGYSAMWMALALPENGELIGIEADEKNIARAKKFFEKAGVLHKVTFLHGDALKIVPELTEHFDMVLNDVHKAQYPEILPLLVERLRVGGLLITDNVLWKGQVTQNPPPDENTRSVQEFNQKLLEYKNLWTSFLPIRDGLSLSVKLKI